ncbi:unnamed protein product [Penicillium salamii]|uniref:Uncharacterized protein n=1 Tax=Penicillium salamii TaxID=1612424 RepID=A0A9W4MZE8_9EURO|nr:unnamed protein product [Penicillium salamii]
MNFNQIGKIVMDPLTNNEDTTFTGFLDTYCRNFDTLIRIYYYATLIYNNQALLVTLIASMNIKVSQDHIINDLKQLSQLKAGFYHTQDLIWPLFVAGTELCGDRVG